MRWATRSRRRSWSRTPGRPRLRTEPWKLTFRSSLSVPNLVIVPVVNGTVKIFNNSPGTVHVVADLNGFFTQ